MYFLKVETWISRDVSFDGKTLARASGANGSRSAESRGQCLLRTSTLSERSRDMEIQMGKKNRIRNGSEVLSHALPWGGCRGIPRDIFKCSLPRIMTCNLLSSGT